MIRNIARKVRDSLSPQKRLLGDIDEPLSIDEKEGMYALLEAVTAHPGFSAERFLKFLDHRADLHGEMRFASELLNNASANRYKGLPFYQLTSEARQKVLESILTKYPYRSNESPLRDRLGLTSKNLDLLTSSRAVKSFRQYVVRELLAFYYEGAEGWAVVGYDNPRGHAAEEHGEGEVIALLEQSGMLLLELTDGTFEEFDQSNYIDGDDSMIWVKGRRQKARINPKVQTELNAQRISGRHRAVATV
jgi:hypothetical protein